MLLTPAGKIQDFRSDLLLAGFVVLEREVLQEVLTVVGGRLHGHGAGGVLGRVAVQQGGIELQFKGLRKEVLQQFGGGGFEDVIPFLGQTSHLDRAHRQQRFPDGNLLAGGDEMVVHQFDPVQATGEEFFRQTVGQIGGRGVSLPFGMNVPKTALRQTVRFKEPS